MSRWKLRTVIVLLCLSTIGISGCGKKEEVVEEVESEYNANGYKQGENGWYYKEGDTTGYYDEYGTRYEIGNTEIAFDDMLFSYLKSISILDFTSAYTYLVDTEASKVINEYLANDIDDGLADGSVETNSITFNRQVYKRFLLSLEAINIEDTVYAGSTNIVTMKVKHKDFTNVDFWLEDYNTIMKELLKIYQNSNSYDDIEVSTVDYLTGYILDEFDKEDAPTKESHIEIVVAQNGVGAWQVQSDSDLARLAQTNNGSYIVNEIRTKFSEYYEQYLEEQEQNNGQ